MILYLYILQNDPKVFIKKPLFCFSVSKSCLTLCSHTGCSVPGLPVPPISWSLPNFMSIESVMPSNRLILCQPFSFCFPSFPASESLAVSCLFASGGQSVGASASSPSALVLPMNIQNLFPLALTGLISLLSKRLSRTSAAPQFKSIISLVLSLLYRPSLTSVHDY